MKKNTLKNSALARLTIRRETIQRLAISRLEEVEGGAPAGAGPRSNWMSCAAGPCTTAVESWFAC
ncbi:MAG TPA: hypothetical protein VGD80_40425 [Kofleriaceae bacterium]